MIKREIETKNSCYYCNKTFKKKELKIIKTINNGRGVFFWIIWFIFLFICFPISILLLLDKKSKKEILICDECNY